MTEPDRPHLKQTVIAILRQYRLLFPALTVSLAIDLYGPLWLAMAVWWLAIGIAGVRASRILRAEQEGNGA